MGYFERREVADCISEEKRLLWRLDELILRIADLPKDEFAYEGYFILSDDDLRYALPEDLYSLRYVIRAIDIAEADLIKEGAVL
jgi:hypothetical protein